MSTPSKPRTLSELLSDSQSALGKLAAGAAQRVSLRQKVIGCLPADLAPHVSGVNLRDDTLVLITDSAAWAPRLRYAGPALRDMLAQRHAIHAQKLSVKVRAPEPTNPDREL